MSTPFALAMWRDRGSGGLPTFQSSVPAEWMCPSNPADRKYFFMMPAASGDRQMLPRQTKSMLMLGGFCTLTSVPMREVILEYGENIDCGR